MTNEELVARCDFLLGTACEQMAEAGACHDLIADRMLTAVFFTAVTLEGREATAERVHAMADRIANGIFDSMSAEGKVLQ